MLRNLKSAPVCEMKLKTLIDNFSSQETKRMKTIKD
jgi:hypothetical protein